jgi:hypothetical protein
MDIPRRHNEIQKLCYWVLGFFFKLTSQTKQLYQKPAENRGKTFYFNERVGGAEMSRDEQRRGVGFRP